MSQKWTITKVIFGEFDESTSTQEILSETAYCVFEGTYEDLCARIRELQDKEYENGGNAVFAIPTDSWTRK